MELTSKLTIRDIRAYIAEIKEYYPEVNLCDWTVFHALVRELACMEQMMISDNNCCLQTNVCYKCPLSFVNGINDNEHIGTDVFSYCTRGSLKGVK